MPVNHKIFLLLSDIFVFFFQFMSFFQFCKYYLEISLIFSDKFFLSFLHLTSTAWCWLTFSIVLYTYSIRKFRAWILWLSYRPTYKIFEDIKSIGLDSFSLPWEVTGEDHICLLFRLSQSKCLHCVPWQTINNLQPIFWSNHCCAPVVQK